MIAVLGDSAAGATFSPDRAYRYSLWRVWSELFTAGKARPRLCNFLMLNPSTADESANDPTVERCERRARRWGYDGLIVTNIFAFRSTDPVVMKAFAEPVGELNDSAVVGSAIMSEIAVCAWGNDGDHLGRGAEVVQLLHRWRPDRYLHCLGINSTGHPMHPLYISYQKEPFIYNSDVLLSKSVDK